MIPDLQASFLCEDVRLEANGGNSIVGIINFIGAPQFPVRVHRLCVWTRWCSGSGTFTQKTKVVLPDDQTTLAEATTEFNLNHQEGHATNINFMGGMEFPHNGIYHIEIYLDDHLKLRYPLPLLKPDTQAHNKDEN